jgi:hypothetical protein
MQDGKLLQHAEDIEKQASEPIKTTIEPDAPTTNEPFSIYTKKQKRWMVVFAAIAAFFSPVTGSIYFPALNTLAKDLDVSNAKITLTITTYLLSATLQKGNIADTIHTDFPRTCAYFCGGIF